MATAEELDNDENVPEGKSPEFYASLTSMPKDKWQQDQAAQILHEAQLEFIQAGISSSTSTGKLDDPPVEVDGWLYDETRYNEKTMQKVHDILLEYIMGEQVIEVIGQIQNAGVLFRERLGN